ncbi:HlyD family efflux transporter periplasmic adaptor subunit [bacterium]|nr:HlyD family efflux transporter periplasmic adaptor subunit [bacterium]
MEEKKKKLPIFWIVLLVIIILLIIVGVTSNGKKNLNKVKVITVAPDEFQGYIFTNGYLRYKYVEKYGGDFDGRIGGINAKSGNFFEKGDELFSIGFSQTLMGLYTDFIRAERNLSTLKREFVSSQKVFDQGGISQKELATLETGLIEARTLYHNHAFREYMTMGYTYNRSKFTVKAPFAGRVLNVNYVKGDELILTRPIITVSRGDNMEAVLNVNILDSKKIADGMSVQITSEVLPTLKMDGMITDISLEPKMLNEAQVIQVKASALVHEALPHNIPIEGKIVFKTLKDVLKVPIESLFEKKGYFIKKSKKKQRENKNRAYYFVYRVIPSEKEGVGKVKYVDVKLGMQNDFYAVIEEGLEKDMRVVSYSEKALLENQEINYEFNSVEEDK